jgi:hypothetical protein
VQLFAEAGHCALVEHVEHQWFGTERAQPRRVLRAAHGRDDARAIGRVLPNELEPDAA